MLPAGSPLSDWLTWLESLSPTEINLGLDRVHEVLGRLEIDLPKHVLLIAGTNGKGSSVALASALLQAAEYRIGAYTSPHVLRYNERIALGSRLATDEEIVAAFEAIEAVRQDVPLTYFEYGTLAAFVLMSQAQLDVWLLEVGMGGRLDATNAIDPTAALITNIALDHCEWLGEDVETIAAEKAGIMRSGIPVVFGGYDVPDAIVGHAEAIGAKLLLPDRDFSNESVPQPGLLGAFQADNAAAVLALLKAAGLADAAKPDIVEKTLPEVRLMGRSQRVEAAGIEWLVDVAHNPAAARVLAETLAADPGQGTTTAIIGMLDDKDVEGTVAFLDAQVDHWIAVSADSQRALDAEELARRIANSCGRPCQIAASLAEAMELARRDTGENDRILVTGSFYLVGPVLQQLELYSRPQS